MSTILKTLKKLEEEKSLLDQKLDLKTMVLKEEVVYPKTIENERSRFFLLVTVVAVILIIVGVVFYYWAPIDKGPGPSKNVVTKTLMRQTPLPKKLPRPSTFEGISMTGIPGDNKGSTVKLEQAATFFEQSGKKPPAIEPPALKQPTPSEPLSKLLPKEASSTEVSSNFKEIENLIQSATISSQNSLATSVTNRGGYIPGVTVKGIIFFDEKSSSNHIIVTTPSDSNLKLRVGDSVQNAFLKSIRPNRVFFLYQDQLIEVSIGQ